MAITKTENNTYRLRLYYPQDIQELLGVGKLYSKTFKTKKEAKEAEINFYASIKETRDNQNKAFVLQLMTKKATEYANFKILRSYVNSIFDWAEELEYIERNKLEKSLKRINETKKNLLKDAKKEEDLYLSFEQLQDWLIAVENDYHNDFLTLQDYTLFLTTFFLSDRKSETYAIKWKDVNFKSSQITISKALDKFGNEKKTKGNKTTVFHIPNELLVILQQWKIQQKLDLESFDIEHRHKNLVHARHINYDILAQP